MKKTAIIAALLALVATAATAAPKYTIGLVQIVEHPSLDEVRYAIIDELARKGYGPDTVKIDYQNGQNSPSLISTICQKFVSQNVDLIIPIGTTATQCAAAATDSIPIVFAAVSDPIAAGLVKDLDKPDGNVTGISDAITPTRTFDLAEELTPGIKTFGVIHNPAEANSSSTARKAIAEIEKRGMSYREAAVSTSGEVPAAISSLVGKVDAVYIPDDNTTATAMTLLSEIAIENKLPVYAAVDSLVHDGAIATCGASYTNVGEQAARMAARVLEGAKIADTPIETVDGGIIEVNEKTAAALGIDVSKYTK